MERLAHIISRDIGCCKKCLKEAGMIGIKKVQNLPKEGKCEKHMEGN